MDACVICGDSLNKPNNTTVTVKTIGIETIKSASSARNDGKLEVISELCRESSSLVVHKSCRLKYISKRDIQYSNERRDQLERQDAGQSTTRKVIPKFDFKEHCLFCAKSCQLVKKKRKNLHARVVSTIEIKNSILKKCHERNDGIGGDVLRRIGACNDLVAEEARYHTSCHAAFTKIPKSLKSHAGRPKVEPLEDSFEKLCNFLSSNEEQCQYSIPEIRQKLESFLPEGLISWTEKHLKRRLKEHFGKRVIITEIPGRSSVLCFHDSAQHLLNNEWYNTRKTDPEEEKIRLLKTSAAILVKDIKLRYFDCDSYPSIKDIISGGEKDIPESLKVFLEALLGGNNPTKEKNVKIFAIANALIAIIRSRSYVAPVLSSLAIHLHRKYGSKDLIDILSKLGFCSSYKEALKFESSVVVNSDVQFESDGFIQYVFDNADFNVKTLDGHGTFHSMGGIVCVTPDNSMKTSQNVPRPKSIISAIDIGKFGNIEVKYFEKKNDNALGNVKLEQLNYGLEGSDMLKRINILNTLWLSNGSIFNTMNVSWNGYMSVAVSLSSHVKSKIIALPFINLDPGNLSTIYTALHFAKAQCEKHNQRHCLVTFDQPLFLKAVQLVESVSSEDPISKISVRLGGFHTEMSYIGSIGYIMCGSGIEELWETVYAKNSVPHMINGHAYSRSIRAHLLTQQALSSFIFKEIKLDELDLSELEFIYKNPTEENLKKELLEKLHDAFIATLVKIGQRSRTAKLWTMYWMMVENAKLFIYAERCGLWSLHLHSLSKMIPFFFASGHLNYAKSSLLYLKQMAKLENIMSPDDLQKFTHEGFFTIRRTDKNWSGNWTDMVIEQNLMRAMKSTGGLTHGRGLTDSSLAKWIASMPFCSDISNAIETFAHVHFVSGEQHVDLRDSRRARDGQDLDKFLDWFNNHPPFSTEIDENLISLSSGRVGDENINCERAQEIGDTLVTNTVGKKLKDVKFKRNDKVKTLALVNKKSVRINNEDIPINPIQLFNRIICTNKTSEELEHCFQYELASYPPSLFVDGQLRKGTKSNLLKELDKVEKPMDSLPKADKMIYVLDGGFLLHKVVWQRPSTYGEIFVQYTKFLHFHYGSDITVVFDGYDESVPSTKVQEHIRRAKSSADVVLQENLVNSQSQSEFLGNTNNKKQFISKLSKHLMKASIKVVQAQSDADTVIVSTALSLKSPKNSVCVIAEDTDVAVLLVYHATEKNTYMMRPGKLAKSDKVTDVYELKNKLGKTAAILPFIHALSGCDSTSAFYKKGKLSFLKLFQGNTNLAQAALLFNGENSNKKDLVNAGEQIVLKLYGATPKIKSLNRQRYLLYNKIVSKQILKSNFELAALPPTNSALEQHIYRVYHQTQEWLYRKLNADEWGWKLCSNSLVPIYCDQPPAPESILKLIFCGCKSTNCTKACSCRKYGMLCTAMCGECNGISCLNSCREVYDTDDEDIE